MYKYMFLLSIENTKQQTKASWPCEAVVLRKKIKLLKPLLRELVILYALAKHNDWHLVEDGRDTESRDHGTVIGNRPVVAH